MRPAARAVQRPRTDPGALQPRLAAVTRAQLSGALLHGESGGSAASRRARELWTLPAPLRWSPRDPPATHQVPQTPDAHGEKGRPDPAGRIQVLTRLPPGDGPEHPVPPGLPAPAPARDGRRRSPSSTRSRTTTSAHPSRPAVSVTNRSSAVDGGRPSIMIGAA